jgi:peptidoglycan L-alanyl-D-glutamate endopeptidase CwlK
MTYSLGQKSLSRLNGVHPDLVKVVKRAIEITEIDFTVLEGVRTMARQRELVASGASKTLKGRHIPDNNKNGFGCAVDLGAFVGGKIEWSWPLYAKLNDAMQKAAKELGIPIEWGGHWTSLKDGPHFQLPWREYP